MVYLKIQAFGDCAFLTHK